VFGFSFFRIGAAGKGNYGCQENTEQAYVKGITSALASHLIFTPSLLRPVTTRAATQIVVSDLRGFQRANAEVP
jgi:hypothetical protein